MSKELTKKYYNGTLPSGHYYFNNGNETYTVEHRQAGRYCLPSGITVVDPVPSYEEYQDIIQQNVNQESAIETYIEQIKQLQEQLEEANKIMKKLSIWKNTYGKDLSCRYLKKWGVK